MTNIVEIKVPDLGGAEDVEVIDVLVSIGDDIKVEDSLISVESDKASMDIPASVAGKVSEIKVAVGDTVNVGDIIITVEAADTANDDDTKKVENSTGENSTVENNTVENNTVENNTAENSTEESNEDSSSDQTEAAPEMPQEEVPQAAIKAPASDADAHTKLVVIGSGPGGYTAAFRAADLGMEVTLIEKYDTLGGVCLNVGCIPSKALLHSAAVISEAREMEKHGISFAKPKIDVDKLRGFKDSVIGKLTSGLAGMAKARKVNVIQGYAKFSSANTLIIEGKEGSSTLSFEQAIIAAGSRVTVLPMFESDDPRVIDSTGALELKEIPKSMLIIGGGIIGLEMATVYSELGTDVSIVEFMPQIIPGADKDLIAPLQKRMQGLVKEIMTNTKVESIESQKDGIKINFASAKDDKKLDSQTFDSVLIATGRRPNGDLIDADKAGVQVDERGFIAVDNQMRTNVAHIFAIGDLVGQPMLAHKATHEAKVAAEVCAGLKSGFEASVIPSVAYTDPEIAWVGLTEIQAKTDGIKYETGVFPWAASGRAIGNDRTEGKTKLLFDPETHKVLGGGIVGPSAGDLIAEVALAIEMGADASDIGLTIHPHPTLSETVAMAAEVYEGTITDLYIPSKK